MESGEKSCHRSPYHIPRIYIEGIGSDEYLELVDSTARRTDRCSGRRCFGKAIYGTLLDEIADLLAKKATRSFIVVLPPDYRKGLLVEAGSYLEPVPLEGMRVVIHVCEGDRVEEGSTLGFIATRKFEVRHIRSHVEGVVVYIYSSPEGPPDRNIVFIAPEEVVQTVTVQS
ncbi:DUF2118 domain-containing protein [Hyperthermus butylicus]|uniref:Conserved archaeal protein n=1 Tax=Hyperthermus butylicus (strain DSM 5456 / JCM 9403 / PLM1-5) TaxID=415426 RepID=A2BK90_HYPBU|nr:DUF2118 domain-containing protein [Hyperthermus butylicus]ABM80401.1 conserved archaeal protein [Hyperthermus butylicus DSM 5456]